MKRKKIWIMTALMVIFVAGVPSTMAVKPFWSLTGEWSDPRGGRFYVRMDGNAVVWYGKGGSGNGFWHHVGTGTIQGNVVQAVFRDIPGSNWPNASGSIRGTISQRWDFVDWDRVPDWSRIIVRLVPHEERILEEPRGR